MKHRKVTPGVEAKVILSTVGSLAASVVVAILNAVLADSTLLGGVSPEWQALIIAAIPPVIVFLSGYAAAHTPRGEV